MGCYINLSFMWMINMSISFKSWVIATVKQSEGKESEALIDWVLTGTLSDTMVSGALIEFVVLEALIESAASEALLESVVLEALKGSNGNQCPNDYSGN